MLRITRVEKEAGSVTLTLAGPITFENVALLELECTHLLEPARTVRLDLVDVDFIDHTALAAVRKLMALGVEIERASLTVKRLLT